MQTVFLVERRRTLATPFTVAGVLLAAAAVCAQTDRVIANSPVPENFYGAGNRVEVRAPVRGDVIVAGREIAIEQVVEGDVLGAGWRVTVSGTASDDVRLAGGEVRVESPIGGDATIAGGDVIMGPQARVGGRAWVTGGTVDLTGTFDRDLHIAAGTVRLGGEIKGPVEITAERLEILSGARVLGPLTYKSPSEAQIAEGAVLAGPVVYTRIDVNRARDARRLRAFSSVVFATHLFGAGLVLLLMAPRAPGQLVSTLRRRPGLSFLFGLLLMVFAPLAALILVITLLALPIGVVIGALFLIAALIGLLTTAFCVGEAEARLLKLRTELTRRRQVLLLLAGVLTLAALRMLPLVGSLVVFVSVAFGLGALILAASRFRLAPAGV